MTRASPHVHTGDLRDEYARQSPAFFGAEYLGVEIGEHTIEWSDLWTQRRPGQSEHFVDIMAARGHGKSGFFSYVVPAWESWRRPNTRGLLISDTGEQTAEFFSIIKHGKEYTDPTGYTWKLPALIDTKIAHLVPPTFERSWTASTQHCKFWLTNRSKVVGKTFGKRFRGAHVHWIGVDDPHGENAAYSELARSRDWDFLKKAVEPMILPGGRIFIVGTPLHKDDIHGRNKRNKAWISASFPAIRTDENGVEHLLWPEFRDKQHLETKRISMGELAFRQEYLLIPATSEASIFPPDLFRRCPETFAHWLRLEPTEEEIHARESWTYYAGVDIALSANTAADYMVVTVLGVDENQNRHVVEIQRRKGMPFDEQLRFIEAVLRPYHDAEKLASVFIESNQMQRVWGDELARTTDLPVVRFTTTGGEKNSLLKGVPALRPLLENGKLRFARADARSRQMTDILIGELEAFAWLDGKLQGVGAHDDCVMSLWLADRAVRGGLGFVVHANEDVEEEGEVRYTHAPTLPDDWLKEGPSCLAGEVGLARAMKLQFVPHTCTLGPETGGAYIYREMVSNRHPCWRCRRDREECGGLPPGEPETTKALPQAPKRQKVAPLPVRKWLDLVEACGGDESLASLIPEDREERIRGWNSLTTGIDEPSWVAAASDRGKIDQLYETLERLIRQ